MKAFILAGGFATRLWPLTEKRAKPLLPLAGKPLLSHIVEKLPNNLAITVSTNAAFADGFHDWKKEYTDRTIEIVVEQTKSDQEKLGALGAVAQWVDHSNIGDDVLLLTGDNYFGFSFDAFLAAYKEGTPLLAAYDIGDKEKAKSFGIVILKDSPSPAHGGGGRGVGAFEEKPANPKSTLVSTGCSIIPKKHLKLLQEYAHNHPDNVGGIFEEFLRQKIAVDCFTFTEPWFDIGSFEAYLEATRELVGKNILFGESAELKDTVCEGSVVLGKGSRVSGSSLRDCVLFEGCTVTDCVLERCIIDNDSVLSGIDLTGKMLRAGTVLRRD